MSNSLQLYGPLQHTRLTCPSLSPDVCSDSCLLSQWCHPAISSSVTPFSSCPQSFPATRSFPVSQLSLSDAQSIRASASASVLPMNIHDWLPLGLTGLISSQSKGLSRVFSSTTVQKASILWCLAFFMIQLSHPNMTTGKITALMYTYAFINWYNYFNSLIVRFGSRSVQV